MLAGQSTAICSIDQRNDPLEPDPGLHMDTNMDGEQEGKVSCSGSVSNGFERSHPRPRGVDRMLLIWLAWAGLLHV